MYSKIYSLIRLVLFAFLVCLNSGILVSAFFSEKNRIDTSEVILFLSIIVLGRLTYREFVQIFLRANNDALEGAGAKPSNSVENGDLPSAVRPNGSGLLLQRLKRRPLLTISILLCALSLPILWGVLPALLNGRPLTLRDWLVILLTEIVIVICVVAAWRGAGRLLAANPPPVARR